MPIGLLFWVLYVVAIIFGAWSSYDGAPNWQRRMGAYSVLWILVGLIGWHDFGPVIR